MLKAQRTTWTLAFLVSAFLSGFAGLGLSQEPAQIPQVQPQEQPLPQQDGKSLPTLPGPPQIGTPSEPQHGSEDGTEFWPLFFGYRLKITDTLIALFTAGLFIATWWLYRATRNLVKGAEITAQRQLRAYVFIQGGFIQIVNNDAAVQAAVALKNFGQTPGYDFESWTLIEIGSSNLAPFAKSAPARQKSIIGPSADLNAPSNVIPLTAKDRAAINVGSKTIFVWGRATYTDAFGRRWTFIFEDKASGKETPLIHDGRTLGIGWGLNPVRYAEESEPA